MNISKIVSLGQNLNNSIDFTKVGKIGKSVITIEELANGYQPLCTSFELPNGAKVSNMLDMFTQATGTAVGKIDVPKKAIDYMA